MCKTVFLFFTFFIYAGCTATFGQHQFGIQFGLNHSNYRYVSDRTDLPTSSVDHFSMGVFYQKPWSEKILFKPTLLYSQRGYRLNNEQSGQFEWLNQAEVKYVEMSLDHRVLFAQQGLRPFLEFGPRISYTTKANSFDFMLDQTFEMNDLNTIDAGLAFAVGFEVPMQRVTLSPFLRYDMSLTNAYNGPANTTMRYRSLSFGMALAFSPQPKSRSMNRCR